ncbi:MAG: hypothetical protein ACXAD7_23640 [Candidatus Kariarchaeaceae archaeon]|jgi:hypothetical protein
MSKNTDTIETSDGIWLSNEEFEKLESDLISFSDFQRLSSVLLWIGIAMIILHIAADIYFHIR